jgi:hypothetical protein
MDRHGFQEHVRSFAWRVNRLSWLQKLASVVRSNCLGLDLSHSLLKKQCLNVGSNAPSDQVKVRRNGVNAYSKTNKQIMQVSQSNAI